jgi:YesN/AraC family two-component response regulator
MPRMGGLDFVAKVREASPDVFIVIMTGFSDENTAIKSAQMGVVDYLVKPFTPQRVDGIIDRLERLAWLRRENKAIIIEDLPMHLDRVDMEIENDLPAAHRIVERVMRMMGIADDDFKLGLLEIVINAIEHGNLEIGFETKSNLPDIHRYMEFVRERSENATLAKRRVRMSIRREGKQVLCEVSDEGRGFDWRATLENASGIDELLHHGRGLLLAQVMFDELRFNEAGNTAYMVKSFGD